MDLKEIDFKKDKISIENYFDEKLKFTDICKKDNVCNYIFPQTYSSTHNYNEDLDEFIGFKKNVIYIGAKFGMEVMLMAKPDILVPTRPKKRQLKQWPASTCRSMASHLSDNRLALKQQAQQMSGRRQAAHGLGGWLPRSLMGCTLWPR